jgi:hypothetical protein
VCSPMPVSFFSSCIILYCLKTVSLLSFIIFRLTNYLHRTHSFAHLSQTRKNQNDILHTDVLVECKITVKW